MVQVGGDTTVARYTYVNAGYEVVQAYDWGLLPVVLQVLTPAGHRFEIEFNDPRNCFIPQQGATVRLALGEDGVPQRVFILYKDELAVTKCRPL